MDLRSIAYWVTLIGLIVGITYTLIEVWDAVEGENQRQAVWKALAGVLALGSLMILALNPPDSA